MKKLFLSALLISSLNLLAAEPKKILVVSVTTGFRHSSIGTAEKELQKLADETGLFVLDYARQPGSGPKKPTEPAKPKALAPDADEKARTKFAEDTKKYESDLQKFKTAIAKWTPEDEAKSLKPAEDMKAVMAKLSLENLKKYDAVIFANTTGDLDLPDKQGFIDWVKAGHGFAAMHSGSDTFHGFKPYIEMLGGEFETHGAQVSVDAINMDKAHPATKHLAGTFTVFDEIYIIKNYQPTNVHELLVLDSHPNSKKPGHFPIAWCKEFGQGKVFYTSLGHREDVWNKDEKGRKNSVEVSIAYEKHILGGIKWILGLEAGDGKPQTK